MSNRKVLIAIPDTDFDTTEVAIPWKYFRENNIEVDFSTEKGKMGQCDPLLLKGVLFGQLGAKKDAIEAYNTLLKDSNFKNPILYSEIDPTRYDMLLLPGGHAKGMKQYLESETLRGKVLQFYKLDKWITSICHGPIVLARTIDPETGKSILYQKKTTALIKFLEKLAYYISAWKLGDYYRTYPEYVQDEITAALKSSGQFQTGGNPFKPYVCVDGKLITARWPNDAHLFAGTLILKLKSDS